MIDLAQHVATQRTIGQARIAVLLDQMCRDLGLDPVTTWRIPRAQEHRDRERARLCAELHAADRPTREEAERAWLTTHRASRAPLLERIEVGS